MFESQHYCSTNTLCATSGPSAKSHISHALPTYVQITVRGILCFGPRNLQTGNLAAVQAGVWTLVSTCDCASLCMYNICVCVHAKHKIEFDGRSRLKFVITFYPFARRCIAAHAAHIYISLGQTVLIPYIGASVLMANRPHLHSKFCVINVRGI